MTRGAWLLLMSTTLLLATPGVAEAIEDVSVPDLVNIRRNCPELKSPWWANSSAITGSATTAGCGLS